MIFYVVYNEHHDQIVNNFVEFNGNGSGWILNRESSLSLHMMQYSRPTSPSSDIEDDDDDASYF